MWVWAPGYQCETEVKENPDERIHNQCQGFATPDLDEEKEEAGVAIPKH